MLNSRILSLVFTIGCVCLPGLLTGCSEKEVTVPQAPSRPVKLFTVADGDGSSLRHFPGRVEAAQRAELAFRISGTLNLIAVKEGDRVEAGDVLARLDPTDFRIKVEERQATFENAKRNFDRGKELVQKGAISRLDFDTMEANFKTSRAALEAAKQDLAYTQLKAPFSGRIARRYIDNFEQVQAKEIIFQMQGTDHLDVVIDIPEGLVRSLSGSSSPDKSRVRDIPVYVEFEDRPDRFDLTIKEIATRADPDTQTYQVRLTMPTPDKFPILSGMIGDVTVNLQTVVDSREVFTVPASAVVADSELNSRLWVLDTESMTVSSRSITVGRLSGRSIEILEGLNGGEEIVSVGAAYLAEGMRVTRMAMTEQAEPRESDPS